MPFSLLDALFLLRKKNGDFFFFGCFTQEAYSVARQFNLIPAVAEQAEYHLFQRDKVEVAMPELYHKIGSHTTGLNLFPQ